ncbi:MAG: hypothetical protein J5710_08340 [Treponema sp.]|nr:hypothetical protein [Treponema sp.]
MANDALLNAKKVKNDEFYTLYEYIQKEVNAYIEFNPNVFKGKTVFLPCDDPEWSNFTKFFAQNFERFGLKKLISTSYAYDSKNVNFDYQPTLFESVDPRFEIKKSRSKGKIFTITEDENNDGKINIEDLKWDYLEGDGDFRSKEVKLLRDESDFIITNPPFSLFREFVAWILEANKKCLIIGQIGMVTYKEIFKEIKNNRLWIGVTANSEDMVFQVPEGAVVNPKDKEKAERMGYKGNYTRQGNACWFTNIDHGRRHAPLSLMTMADNLKFSKHKDLKEQGYIKYDNYDAIEVKYVDSIPSDYEGVMGVSPSFLSKYNPTQFQIIGCSLLDCKPIKDCIPISDTYDKGGNACYLPENKTHHRRLFPRIFIRKIGE